MVPDIVDSNYEEQGREVCASPGVGPYIRGSVPGGQDPVGPGGSTPVRLRSFGGGSNRHLRVSGRAGDAGGHITPTRTSALGPECYLLSTDSVHHFWDP